MFNITISITKRLRGFMLDRIQICIEYYAQHIFNYNIFYHILS